jgi:CheY-like chemotaxis protein
MRHQSGRILLVDVEPLVRKLISRYLVAEGYVVRTAVDGLDAIGILRAGAMDLIISDRNMPRMSGAELLKVVRRRVPQIPFMVIGGDTADETPKGVAPTITATRTESISRISSKPCQTWTEILLIELFPRALITNQSRQ